MWHLNTQNIIKNYVSCVINRIRPLAQKLTTEVLRACALVRATSFKLGRTLLLTQRVGRLQSPKLQAPSSLSIKRQASSPVAQASSFKPQASSSKILDPRKSFTVQGPRASTKINELLGCLT